MKITYLKLKNIANLESAMDASEIEIDFSFSKNRITLLNGPNGSGKTSVFLKLIQRVLKDNKGIIVMVPEISLTPQFLNIFKGKFGDKIAAHVEAGDQVFVPAQAHQGLLCPGGSRREHLYYQRSYRQPYELPKKL